MLCPDEIFRNNLKLSIAKDNHFFFFFSDSGTKDYGMYYTLNKYWPWTVVYYLEFQCFQRALREKNTEEGGASKREKRRENEIQSVENWVLNWPGVCLSPKRWSCCNENGIPDAYEGRLFPLLIPLSKKTSLFLKVIVAVIRERVLLRVTAKGLRGSGWLDNLVPIPASLPSSWASPPPACLLVWTQSAGWNYLPAPGKLNMISDLSFLCSTVTFADPPTLQDQCNEQRTKRRGFFYFF